MIYGYARVSTRSQARDGNGLDVQRDILKEHGVLEENIYWDSFTGTKFSRPNFDSLMDMLQTGDTLVVSKLDRFARSVSQASDKITELVNRGIRVDVANIGVMDNTSTSMLIRNILLAIAQFERDMIVERTQEGKAVARTKTGFKEGRPQKYTDTQLDHAVTLLKVNSYKQVELMTRISKSTLQRAKRVRKKMV